MADVRTIIVAALLAAALTYGGFLVVEAVSTGGIQAPDADQITVQGTTYHLDRTGRPTVVGELYNGNDHAVENVSVTVTFYNDDTQVGEVTDTILTNGIDPGESAPFDVHYTTNAEVTDYEVTFSADRTTTQSHPLDATAEIVNEAQNRIILSGSVENTGTTAMQARVVATFYDENGSVLGARTARPTGAIQPGDAAPFDIRFETLGDVPSLAQDFASYTLTVEPVTTTTNDIDAYIAASATTNTPREIEWSTVRRVRTTPG